MTARARSSTSALWPPLDPAILTRLPQAGRHPDPASLPASARYRATQRPTLQDEAELLDYEEDLFYNDQAETRAHGYTWLVPLGRQNTQEEDAESACSPSPHPDSPPTEQTADEGALANGGPDAGTGAQEDPPPPEEVDLDAEIEDASDPEPELDPEDLESDSGGDEDENEDEGVNSDLNSEEEDGEDDSVSDVSGSTSRGGEVAGAGTGEDAAMQVAP